MSKKLFKKIVMRIGQFGTALAISFLITYATGLIGAKEHTMYFIGGCVFMWTIIVLENKLFNG